MKKKKRDRWEIWEKPFRESWQVIRRTESCWMLHCWKGGARWREETWLTPPEMSLLSTFTSNRKAGVSESCSERRVRCKLCLSFHKTMCCEAKDTHSLSPHQCSWRTVCNWWWTLSLWALHWTGTCRWGLCLREKINGSHEGGATYTFYFSKRFRI